MLTGLIGILGVAVGAGLTSWFAHIAERRKEKMIQLAARRLLCTDLLKSQALLNQVRETGQWSNERTALPTDAFRTHAFTLAQHLPPESWKLVEGSILGVQRLELIRYETQDNDREITQEDLHNIRRVAAFIDKTLDRVDDERWAIDAVATTKKFGSTGSD